MKSKATAARKPAHSEGIRTEAGHASLKTAALGADWFLPYPRPLADYRKGEGFNQETRVWECILFHVLRHEGDPAATYAQVAGEIRPDGSETGIKNGRRRGELRPMTQADIGIILQMGKGDVSRAVKKLVKEGVLRQEGRTKLHLVGNPDCTDSTVKQLTRVACTRNFISPFLPPSSHPQREEWLARLSQVDQQLAAAFNGRVAVAMREIRHLRKAETVSSYAEIAASYLGVEPSEVISIIKQGQESTQEPPAAVSEVSGTRNSAPSAVSGTDNSEAPSVACSGDYSREIQKEGESAQFFSKTPPRGLAGHSGPNEPEESQPASQPGSFQKNNGQTADKQTDAENLEEFFQELNRRFTRRFAVPPSRKWTADILRRLKGADWQQLFDLIENKPHIFGWAGVARLADDCAATQESWRGAEETTEQLHKSKSDQRREAYIRRKREEESDG